MMRSAESGSQANGADFAFFMNISKDGRAFFVLCRPFWVACGASVKRCQKKRQKFVYFGYKKKQRNVVK